LSVEGFDHEESPELATALSGIQTHTLSKTVETVDLSGPTRDR